MLTSVTFEGYRAFERLTCDGLARVNLFVGQNNSGKTTILEGIEALVGGPEAALVTGPNRRGEQTVVDWFEGERRGEPDITHLFHGHRLQPGRSFKLEGRGPELPPLRVEVIANEPSPRFAFPHDLRLRISSGR